MVSHGSEITADFAATQPPAGRRVLLSHLDETLRAAGEGLEMI